MSALTTETPPNGKQQTPVVIGQYDIPEGHDVGEWRLDQLRQFDGDPVAQARMLRHWHLADYASGCTKGEKIRDRLDELGAKEIVRKIDGLIAELRTHLGGAK